MYNDLHPESNFNGFELDDTLGNFLDISSLYHTESVEHLRWSRQILQNVKENDGYDLTGDTCGHFLELEFLFYEECPDYLKWKANLYESMGLSPYNEASFSRNSSISQESSAITSMSSDSRLSR